MLEMAKGKLLSLIYLENQLVFTPVTRMRYSRQGNGRKSMFVKKIHLIFVVLNVIIWDRGHYSVRNSNKQQGWPNNVQRTIQYTIPTYYSYIERELQHLRTVKCASPSYNEG